MDIALLIAALLAGSPALASICGSIFSYCKQRKLNKKTSELLLSEFKTTKEEILKTKDMDELKSALRLAYQDNRDLKKIIKELLTKIDRIERKEE